MSRPPMTFAQRWDAAAAGASADRTFLVFEGPGGSVSQWTYREFDEAITSMGAKLAASGVTQGSSVHVVLRNCPAFVAIWLACARLGAWLVPVDPTSTARDIRPPSRTLPNGRSRTWRLPPARATGT
jgi:carnitine-CoA ligase